MDLVELLMSEHASLRIYFRHLREMKSDFFFELDDFIINCHAKIEDEAVFPILLRGGPDSPISQTTKRLMDEHELVKMLGNNMRLYAAQEKAELGKDKITLYADTVESHNTAEEISVFKAWKDASNEVKQKAAEQAKEIIRSFGLERYLRVTGFSQEYLSSLQ